MNISNEINASVHEFLTRNILIKHPDGSYDSNKYGDLWQLVWQVVFTKGTQVVLTSTFEGPQLPLSEYQDGTKLAEVCSTFRKQVDEVLSNLLLSNA
jgi:hypothetical protein